MRVIGAFALALALAACVKQEGVLRVVDGNVVEGAYVEPEAYAAFLRGAIAEERGEKEEALKAYAAAAALDPNDPEIWARIARVACLKDPSDHGSDAALARAFALDASYAEAWAVRAECAMARGDAAGAEAAARRAFDADRMATDLELLLARATDGGRAEATRDRLVVLTLAHAESVAAWRALAAWGLAHDDVALYARALAEIARRAPLDRAKIATAVKVFAGDGEIAIARTLAAAVVDAASADGFGATSDEVVARLAVDAAIVAGDVERARLRATRTHLGLERAAGRAALLGAANVARDLALPVVAADPHARGAAMALAAVAGERGDLEALRAAFVGLKRAAPGRVPAECLVAFARTVARVVSDEEATRTIASTAHDAVVAGDALAAPVAVELTARGVFPEAELPLDAAIELAARRMQPPPDAALGGTHAQPAPTDARHELLALALARPASPRATELAKRLARVRDRDPLVAVAHARMALARSEAPDAAPLLARDPGDPLVAAAALDLATKRGDAATAARARATLIATARTPAERARTAQ